MNELKKLRLLRAHLQTALNYIDVYEKADIKEEWGLDSKRDKEIALKTIETRLFNATELIGIKKPKK
jgi:hypothetical protein